MSKLWPKRNLVNIMDGSIATEVKQVNKTHEKLLYKAIEAAESAYEETVNHRNTDTPVVSWSGIEAAIAAYRETRREQGFSETQVPKPTQSSAVVPVCILSSAVSVFNMAREMLGVLEDNGGHDGLGGKAYMATLDAIDGAKEELGSV